MMQPKTASFLKDIETLCLEKGMQYIDAVCYWCEQNNFDVEYAADMIKKNAVFVAKLQVEAEDLNYLKRTARLPI